MSKWFMREVVNALEQAIQTIDDPESEVSQNLERVRYAAVIHVNTLDALERENSSPTLAVALAALDVMPVGPEKDALVDALLEAGGGKSNE